MSPNWYGLFMLALGFSAGGILGSMLTWTLVMAGAKRLLDKTISQGWFTYMGRPYIVKPGGRTQ